VQSEGVAGLTARPGGSRTAPAAGHRAGAGRPSAAATAVVLLAAQAPVAGTSYARLPAALAITATTACLVLALRTRRRPPG
ncbi:hypothetical protein ACWEQU_13375, partial [Streptomyces nodosus]